MAYKRGRAIADCVLCVAETAIATVVVLVNCNRGAVRGVCGGDDVVPTDWRYRNIDGRCKASGNSRVTVVDGIRTVPPGVDGFCHWGGSDDRGPSTIALDTEIANTVLKRSEGLSPSPSCKSFPIGGSCPALLWSESKWMVVDPELARHDIVARSVSSNGEDITCYYFQGMR
jgi:hypothetical protein